MDKPAFASSVDSGANLMVAPSVPPGPSLLSKVPAACQARRIIIGQALAFWLMVAFRMSDLRAFMFTVVMAMAVLCDAEVRGEWRSKTRQHGDAK